LAHAGLTGRLGFAVAGRRRDQPVAARSCSISGSLLLPDGQDAHGCRLEFAVLPICLSLYVRIFGNKGLTPSPNQKYGPRVPPSQEGRFAIVTNVEGGMRWTCRVAALLRRRTIPMRTQKRVVLASRR